jgi:isopenicillin-N N-acyltransferase-like protein
LLEKIAPNTLYRAGRMRALLRAHSGAVSFEHMRSAAADHFGAPYAICRHPDASEPNERRTMTVGAVLIDLEARTMHVANGPPCANDYVAFSLQSGK